MLLAGCNNYSSPPPQPMADSVEADVYYSYEESLEEQLEEQLEIEEPGFLYDDSIHEPFITTDDVLDQLETAAMAFNLPEVADIKETVMAQLKVDYHLSAIQLSETLMSHEGHLIAGNIPVSKILRAELIAPTLEVTPLTAASQALSSQQPTEWLWSLRPVKSGEHLVVLTINAVVKVDDEQAERTIKVFSETMYITVTARYVISTWIKEHWQWLLSGLIFPLTVWFWNRKRKKEKSNRS